MDIIREAYSRTTPYRNGIPLEEAFNPVYHLVFDEALKKLINSGIIEEPRKRIDGGRYAVFVTVLRS